MERNATPGAGSTGSEGHLQGGSGGKEDQCVLSKQKEQEKAEEGRPQE